MKQRTLPVYVLALALWLHSCKPESPCDENQRAEHLTYHLEPGTKEQVPYRADGLDTLVYISDVGDTATLYGQGIKTDYTGESRNRNANPDCPLWDTWSYETWEWKFTGTDQRIRKITYKAIAGAKTVTGRFEIESISPVNYCSYSFNERSDTTKYLDTVIINANVYYGFMMNCYNSTDLLFPPVKTNVSVLYHYKHGILKFEIDDMVWRKRL